jgi:hypothetical protein
VRVKNLPCFLTGQGDFTRLLLQGPIHGRLEGKGVRERLFRPGFLTRFPDDVIEGERGRHKQLRRFLPFREVALRQRPQGSDAAGVDVLDARTVAPVLAEDPIGQGTRGMGEDARFLSFKPLRAEVSCKGL